MVQLKFQITCNVFFRRSFLYFGKTLAVHLGNLETGTYKVVISGKKIMKFTTLRLFIRLW